jgi:RNA polymerase sigma-70 factor, ECF subfamily
MSDVHDIQVLDRVLAGDTEAFAGIIEKYQSMVYRYAYSRVHNRDEASDITQEIFMMVLESLSTFRRESKFSTWFYSIMVNYCRNYRKKAVRYSALSLARGEGEDEFEIQIADERQNPEAEVITNDSLRIVKEELYALPDDYREILILRDIEGMAYNEIEKVLGINLSNVKVRIHRGRELLKKRLGARGVL